MAAGQVQAVAQLADGSVWNWGYLNGVGATTTPTQVVGLAQSTAIAAGYQHSLSLARDGTVWAWGSNVSGQLGNGTIFDSSSPLQVLDSGGGGHLTGIVGVAAGSSHSLALAADGTVWAWGSDSSGELGDKGSVAKSLPVHVLGPGGTGVLDGVVAVAAGSNYSVALRADGTVWAWGANGGGQLGNGTTASSSIPIQVRGPGGAGVLSGIVAIAAVAAIQSQFVLALKNDSTVWGWGANSYGNLGDGTSTPRFFPVQVVGPGGVGSLSSVTAVRTGGNHALAAN